MHYTSLGDPPSNFCESCFNFIHKALHNIMLDCGVAASIHWAWVVSLPCYV